MNGARLALAALWLSATPALAGSLVENAGQWPEEVRFASPDGAVVLAEAGLRTHDGTWTPFEPGTTLHPEGDLGYPTHFLHGRDPSRWVRGARSYRRVVIAPAVPPPPGEPTWVVDSATLLGGSADDTVVDVDVAPDGHAVVLSTTGSPDFPTTGGAWDEEGGGFDWVITKVSPDGTALVWSTFVGGTGTDLATAVHVDEGGEVTALGTTLSSDFPVSAWAVQDLLNLGENTYQPDLAVARLSADGASLEWATLLGGGGHETAGDIVVHEDRALVVGRTDSANFPTAAGPPYGGHHGDALLAILDGDGATLADTVFWGGDGSEVATALAVHPGDGSVVVVGNTTSMNFPVSPGALMGERPAFNSGFALRYQPWDHHHPFVTYLAGPTSDSLHGVAVDGAGALLVLGRTMNGYDGAGHLADNTALDWELSGDWDAWVARLDGDGDRIAEATLVGGEGSETAAGLTLLPDGSVAVFGTTDSADLLSTEGGLAGDQDAFLWVLEPDLSDLRHGSWYGGSAAEDAVGIAAHGGDLALVGTTTSDDFATTAGAWASTPAGGKDLFVVRVDGPGGAPADTGWDTGPGVAGGGGCGCSASPGALSLVWLLPGLWLVRRRRLP